MASSNSNPNKQEFDFVLSENDYSNLEDRVSRRFSAMMRIKLKLMMHTVV